MSGLDLRGVNMDGSISLRRLGHNGLLGAMDLVYMALIEASGE